MPEPLIVTTPFLLTVATFLLEDLNFFPVPPVTSIWVVDPAAATTVALVLLAVDEASTVTATPSDELANDAGTAGADMIPKALKAAKEAGIHTAVETSGFAPWEHIERLLPFVDLWLWDVKASREKHERLTGVPADPIRENLKKLDQASSPVFLRCPLVPNVNDFEEDLNEIAALANGCAHVQEIDLEPYHPLGEGKSRALGRKVFHAPFASEADKKRWKEFLSARTKVPVHI